MSRLDYKPIAVNEPLLNGNEKKYLCECIDTGWISSEGPFVQKLEREFASFVGRKHGIAVCNGSAALDAAILALKLSVGDEVILPSFTIISCAAAVVRAGLKPVVVDSDPLTFNMDVKEVEKKITKRTRAIMPVHIYGLPVDMDPILALAKKHNLRIVEDAAEQIGQTYNGKLCGSFGDLSAFSFYPNKHITTGEGGIIVTDDDALAERCRSIRNLCFKPEKRFLHDELGYNFRMTNLQAAIGVAQIEQLEVFLKKKRQVGQWYNELLRELPYIELPMPNTLYADNIYWVYSIVLKDEFPYDAEWVMKKLASRKIGTRPFFFPMHEQPVFRKMGLFEGLKFPVAERIARRGFYLPSGLALTREQAEVVTRVLEEVLKEA